MVIYYTVILTLLLFLQKNKVGVSLVLLSIILIVGGDNLLTYYRESGDSSYWGAVKIEVLSLFLCGITYKLHKSKYIFLVIIVSLLLNSSYILVYSYAFKLFIYDNYNTLNTILFETIVALCLVESRIYTYFGHKLKREKQL